MARPAGGAEPFRWLSPEQLSGGAAVAALAVGLLFPPDVYPEAQPLLLALVAGSLALGSRPIAAQDLAQLGLLAGWGALSLSWSRSPARGAELLLSLVLAAGLYLAASRSAANLLVPALAVVATLHGAHALWQHFVSLPELAASLAGLRGGDVDLIVQRAAGGRAFSTFALPGHLGALLVALAPLLATELMTRGGSASRRTLAGLGLCAAAAGLLATRALGAVLALAAAGAVGWVVGRGRRARGLVVAGMVGSLILVAVRLPELADRAHPDHPIASRLALWARATEVVAQHPVAGVGLGGLGIAWLPFLRSGDVPTMHAHNAYLEWAADLGLPALVLLLLFFWSAIRTTRLPAARVGATVLLLHAAIDFDFQSDGLLLALFGLLGFAAAADDAPGEEPSPRRMVAWVAAMGALASLTWGPGPRRSVAGSEATSVSEAPGRRRWDARQLAADASRRMAVGSLDEALRISRAARRVEPRSAALAALEADVQVRRGEAFGAWFAYRDAARIHPARAEYDRSAQRVEAILRAAIAEAEGER